MHPSMRNLLQRVLVLFLVVVGALAQEPPAPDVVLRDPDKLVLFGGRIELSLRGRWLQDLETVMKGRSGPVGEHVSIHLDGTLMRGLECFLDSREKETILNVTLDRDSQSAESRKNWAAVLSRDPDAGFCHKVGMAVGLVGHVPIHVGDISLAVNSSHVIWIVIFASIVIFAVLLWSLVRWTNMLRDGGKDSAFSLGKSQMAFWGLLVVLCFAALWVVGGGMEWIPPQVLVLLGISSSTGLASLVVGAGKRAEAARTLAALAAEEAKLAPAAASGSAAQTRLDQIKEEQAVLTAACTATPSTGSFWQDICTDTAGLSFHRLQIVLWTIVLGCIFVHHVVLTLSMPEFPETLLLLMGISNGTYLGFKIPEK